MGYPKLAPLLSENSSATTAPTNPGPVRRPWVLLGGLGIALVLVGGADLLIAWVPQSFGNPEWEFGTVSATMDGLPVPALGLALLVSSALAQQSRRLVRALGAISVVLALLLVAAGVLYATAIPIALQSIQDPVLRLGLLKAMAKTGVQVLVYPTLFIWIGVRAWRAIPPRLAVKD